ncbi:DUF3801 domain-containing protein [Porcincola intestinalis]|uniref:Uncharacterized protein n=1 Tax=Porcincola intestinalis TaxID=2606632 RepID=A0A6L5X6J6_9FIRM|nr:DUF3801 domain-containing protein [Porcincola intestinalis]MSS14002.1 hypothetical protein [Porcincola intestinalis]
MSEVGDAVQVVMLFGRGAMLVGNISLKLAMQIVKLMNTIYLAKWEGKVSLNRLRQTKGDDFVFINVSSEKREDLAAVEREMKAHGIMFARMPDLCGGDARTQYAIASSDAVKMKAMLLDHTAGPNRHIRVGPISEADYMMTGKKADGTDTKEMEALKQSAQKNVEATMRKGKDSVEKTPDYRKRAGSGVAQQAEQEHVKVKNTFSQIQQKEQKVRETVSDVRIRVRDSVAEKGEESVFWISQKPVFENRQFSQFMLPDGIHSIFVRHEDILPYKDAATGKRVAVIFKDQAYSMMNMQKVDVVAADGSKAIAMFKLPGGAVVAHGSQQPDRKKPGSEVAVKSEREGFVPQVGKEVKPPEKIR